MYRDWSFNSGTLLESIFEVKRSQRSSSHRMRVSLDDPVKFLENCVACN